MPQHTETMTLQKVTDRGACDFKVMNNGRPAPMNSRAFVNLYIRDFAFKNGVPNEIEVTVRWQEDGE